jgi:uncharacterized protein (TIGR03067 family)
MTSMLLFVAGLLLGQSDSPKEEPKKDPNAAEIAKLQGKWICESVTTGGEKRDLETELEFTGAKYVQRMRGQRVEEATVTLDAKKKPPTMDVKITYGQDKDKTQFAIYRLEGDKLTLCCTPAGAEEKDRPKEFKAEAGSEAILFVFKKEKKEKEKEPEKQP